MSIKVDGIIAKMSLEQKIGQLFTLGFSGGVITPTVIKMIKDFHCGGLRISPNLIAVFKKYRKAGSGGNERFQDEVPMPSVYLSPKAHLENLNDLQEIAMSRKPAIPLHISADWEGGSSADLIRGGYPMFPSPMGLACSNNPEFIYKVSRTIAEGLRASGVTNIHSPVIDVNDNHNNPEINVRAYGDTPAKVVNFATAALKGFTEGGIIATAKHFPGRGNSDQDAHYETIILEHDKEHLLRNELYPYIELIKKGLPSIMLGHIICPALGESKLPATVSRKIIQDFLRQQLNFGGVITTDSMTMEGIQEVFPVHQACGLAIAAGVDLVLFKSENLEDLRKSIDEIIKMVNKGLISEEQINSSVKRVLLMKEKVDLFDTGGYCYPKTLEKKLNPLSTRQIVRKAAEKATLLVRDQDKILPLKESKKILVVEQSSFISSYCNDEYFHPYMLWETVRKYAPGADLYKLSFFGDKNNLKEVLSIKDKFDIVIATNMYNRGALPNTDFVGELASRIKKLIVITNTPYELTITDNMKCVLCIFSEFTPSLEVASDIIFGKKKPQGKWPIHARPS